MPRARRINILRSLRRREGLFRTPVQIPHPSPLSISTPPGGSAPAGCNSTADRAREFISPVTLSYSFSMSYNPFRSVSSSCSQSKKFKPIIAFSLSKSQQSMDQPWTVCPRASREAWTECGRRHPGGRVFAASIFFLVLGSFYLERGGDPFEYSN
jgi:hypothetical protein